MKCGSEISYENIVYKIIKINRLKKNRSYIFVGKPPKNIKDILEKYQSQKELDKKSLATLGEYYSKNNLHTITAHKTKEFEFIFQHINVDDSITQIKRKIFTFLSTIHDFIIENNQELWVVKKSNEPILLGYRYSNLDIKPSLLSELKPDYKKFVGKNGQIILGETLINNNDTTLYEATDKLDIKSNEIYLHNLMDEVEYLKKSKKEIDTILLNGYLVKHWPNGNINFSTTGLFEDMERLKKLLNTEDKLMDYVNDIKPDSNLFGNCSVIQVRVHITHTYKEDFIDLLDIFQLLKLDTKTPFMRYKDPEWVTPYYVFYKPLIEDGTITERQVKEWIANTKKNKDTNVKELKYSTRGLTIKRFLYQSEEGPKYSTINIHKNGNVEISFAYKEVQKAKLSDVYAAIADIGDLLKKVNEIDYRIHRRVSRNIKLLLPELSYDKSSNNLNFHGATHLILIDTILPLIYEENIDYKKLNDFSYQFSPYVSPVLTQKNYEERMLLMKFKRVSNYSKMNEIYEFIHKTFQQVPNTAVENVVRLVSDNFGKSIDDAFKLYKEWERKYGFLGTNSKGMRQTGVELKLLNNKIHIKGSKSILQLTSSNDFIIKFLSIFLNQKKYITKNIAKNIFSGELANLEQEIDEEQLDLNINNNLNKYGNVYNYGNGLGTAFDEDYGNYMEEITINDDENVEEIQVTEEDPFAFNRNSYLAKNDELTKDVRIQCDDQIKEKDTCTDFCEDEMYTLRRLQKYDISLFRFPSTQKFQNYARKCQPQDRQPVVFKHDPKDDKRIDPRSYTYSLKYGSSSERQNYYLCAQVWCPYQQIPIFYGDIKNSIVERKMRKGKCLTAKCPQCLKEGRITWLRIVQDDKFHPYPGFFDPSLHPLNLCMPCCYKMPMNNPKSKKYTLFQKCIGEESNEDGEEGATDYIMGREKMPLPKNRYGILPAVLAKLFSSKCETGYMMEGNSCFLRRGVSNDEKQSFLQAISSVVESKQFQISKSILKDFLLDKMLTPRMFNSLNNGELKIMFKNPSTNKSALENFKAFIKSDESYNEEYLWDFLSRSKVLLPDGLNIFIITNRAVLCPQGFDAKDFFDLNKQSAFLYTDGRYFEPLFKVTKSNKGELIPQKLFTSIEPEVTKLYNMVTSKCVTREMISWKNIRKENLPANKYFELKDEVSFKHLNNILTKNQKLPIKIVGQVKDQYNKAYGLLTEAGILLPFLPQGEILELEVKEYKPIDLVMALKAYEKLAETFGLPYTPVHKIENVKGNVNALLLENNIIIPVKESNGEKIDLPISLRTYHDRANDLIAENKTIPDERMEIVQYIKFMNESYERLRFEISRNMQTDSIREDIQKIIKESESMQSKRDKLFKKLFPYGKNLVDIVDNLPFDINTYYTPNIRRQCGPLSRSEVDCNKTFHCHYRSEKCKLLILKKDPVNGIDTFKIFIDRIVEELLRNKFLGDEIVEDKIDDIIDKKEINFSRKDEILVKGTIEPFAEIKKYYEKKKTYFINPSDMYSTVQPKYYGINQDKYLISNKELTIDILNLQILPSHWVKLLTKAYKMYDENVDNDTLFFAMIRALKTESNSIKNIKTLKQILIDKVDAITKDDINKYQEYANVNRNDMDQSNRLLMIYKKVNGTIYKNINTISNLKDYMLNDDYPANEVDVFVISLALDINIILLERRVTKTNPLGFTAFLTGKKNPTIMLFSQKRFNKRIFSVVQRDGTYIFKLPQLPEEFRKQVLDLFGNNKKVNNKKEQEKENANKKKASVKIEIKKKIKIKK
jgi:hypothetical protein